MSLWAKADPDNENRLIVYHDPRKESEWYTEKYDFIREVIDDCEFKSQRKLDMLKEMLNAGKTQEELCNFVSLYQSICDGYFEKIRTALREELCAEIRINQKQFERIKTRE